MKFIPKDFLKQILFQILCNICKNELTFKLFELVKAS